MFTMQAHLRDSTGDFELVLFDGIADHLLGIDAASFKDKVDEGEIEELNSILDKCVGVEMRFRLRCKRMPKSVSLFISLNILMLDWF